ncbi:MAG TPA: DUF4287 domain-containing protein [Puia sp.]|nr:DUF4287 domain-containing protein [Puia sp.]
MSFQAYLDNIKAKTGKTAEDFKKLAEKKGLLNPTAKAGDIVAWLKKDFGLGHGHAMAVYAVFTGHKAAAVNDRERADLPVKLGKPAQRALAAAGISTLKQLSKLTEESFSSMHGIGPKTVQEIKKALTRSSLSFAKSKK